VFFRKLILISAIIFLAAALSFAGGGKEEIITIEEWEELAQLGAHRPAQDDWQAIEAAAEEEAIVVVYSLSSRVFEFGRTFDKKYGIRVEAHDITTPELREKLRLEQQSGVYNCDVVLIDDIPTFYKEFLDTGMVYNFVPTDLKDKLIDEAKESPLLIHHYGMRVIMYNTNAFDEQPIDSWWDVTRPEWHGKVLMKDPMRSGAEFNMFASFVQHADEMAQSYLEEFGEEIVLHDTENAGYEFLKRLMDNGLILMADSGTVVRAVGSSGKETPVLGLLGYSKLRTFAEENKPATVAMNLSPVTGCTSTTIMTIPKFAPHPNAAKLMIKWMKGNDNPHQEKMAGYQPYHVFGNWSVRKDITEPEGQVLLHELDLYVEDPEWLYQNSVRVRDFWLQNQ